MFPDSDPNIKLNQNIIIQDFQTAQSIERPIQMINQGQTAVRFLFINDLLDILKRMIRWNQALTADPEVKIILSIIPDAVKW